MSTGFTVIRISPRVSPETGAVYYLLSAERDHSRIRHHPIVKNQYNFVGELPIRKGKIFRKVQRQLPGRRTTMNLGCHRRRDSLRPSGHVWTKR